MEAKTIGKFITALRKANGMTQKDLAEKLNVSDKTVSRWERDEGSPDLSVIPILAEIFDVTCDELLRGERKSPEERAAVSSATSTSEEETTAKGEKQRQRLLKASFSQYQSRTYISMGLSVVGIIVALICNLAFLKAVLGFLLGAVFFAASIVCQAIFKNRAFLSVEDASLDAADLSRFKRDVIRLAQKSIGLTIAVTGFTFPLALVDAYVGLGADSMLLFGLIGAAVFLLAYAVILYFYNASLFKKEGFRLEEQEAAIYQHNHTLQKRCALILALLLAVTYLGQTIVGNLQGPLSPLEGTTFQDYESFIAFMEQDIPYEYSYRDGALAIEMVPDSTIYYDDYGNEISKEKAQHRTLTDKNGNVVCEYQDRNNSVASMHYTIKGNTVLPITVYTYKDLQTAENTAKMRQIFFYPLYVAEVAAVIWLYFKKKAK